MPEIPETPIFTNVKEGSVEHLKQLIDTMKKSIHNTNERLDFSLDHIKQLNDKIYILEQRLRASRLID